MRSKKEIWVVRESSFDAPIIAVCDSEEHAKNIYKQVPGYAENEVDIKKYIINEVNNV